MPVLYELAVLGAPSDAQLNALEEIVGQAVSAFGMTLGAEVAWLVQPDEFSPSQRRAAAAVYFGSQGAAAFDLPALLKRAVPVLPVVSDVSRVREEIPQELRHINCLDYRDGGAARVATALLECAGLLPRQRRVFLSYKRNEARHAALQLFDAISARHFEVFLDTHSIAPAEDFQAMLWHRLCDSDVLLMLDTQTYFESRWTSAEFGRAQAKGISVLRVDWPDSTPSARTATASRAELLAEEVDPATGHLSLAAVERICLQLEEVRSESHAVRNVNLVSQVRNGIESIHGQFVGIGQHKSIHLLLPDGKDLVVYPTVGVPTSASLHEAVTRSPGKTVAVLYDHVGILPSWQAHMDWLGEHVRPARWVKASEAAWQFADWEA
ncbi:hypothetical protein HNQ51_000177 [Inhella inkyongensis]|uniref:TIR domain-containing protein n=1 Tax=Inhella inkyongensis TaxID=392593 RepID=A0A840S201_9BURK|nr:toll/interleukin-1 receptor domain-containing protein [Inhella inkyongensis]MBB5202884.1 hypothetical protein [Inhella inkyongensis]